MSDKCKKCNRCNRQKHICSRTKSKLNCKCGKKTLLKGGKVRKDIFTSKNFKKTLDIINNTFLDYRVRNFDFHTGDDLSDHSIWSALAVRLWINNKHDWVKGIKSNYKNLTILCAYLHDIGKAGDGDFTSLIEPGWKETHPDDGFEIMLGKKKFITHDIDIKETEKGWFEDNNKKWQSGTKRAKYCDKGLNMRKFLLEQQFTEEELAIIALAVGMHYDFGDLVVLAIGTKDRPGKLYDTPDKAYKNYLEKFNKKLKETKNVMNDKTLDIEQALRICITVSAADVRGANVVDGQFLHLKEPVSNYPKVPVRNMYKNANMYSLFNYDNNVLFRDNLLKIFKKNNK